MPRTWIDLKPRITPGETRWALRWALRDVRRETGGRMERYRVELRPDGVVAHFSHLDQAFFLPLQSSPRFQYPCWKSEEEQRVVYYSGSVERSAKIVGLRLLVRRRGVRIRMLLEIEPPDAMGEPGEMAVVPGLRVMSLALLPPADATAGSKKPFAACAVFQVVQGRPSSGLAYPVDPAGDLWARQERLFYLFRPQQQGRFAAPTSGELVVQEARGHKYGARKGWFKRHGVCRLILLGVPDDPACRRLAAAIRREASVYGIVVRRTRLATVSANLAAAQSLQRRFWTR